MLHASRSKVIATVYFGTQWSFLHKIDEFSFFNVFKHEFSLCNPRFVIRYERCIIWDRYLFIFSLQFGYHNPATASKRNQQNGNIQSATITKKSLGENSQETIYSRNELIGLPAVFVCVKSFPKRTFRCNAVGPEIYGWLSYRPVIEWKERRRKFYRRNFIDPGLQWVNYDTKFTDFISK